MGYSVETLECNFVVKAENFEKAYDAMCKLNAEDGLKEGYSYLSCERPADSKSVSSNPHKYFSFMPWNYDEVYTDFLDVLSALGFEVSTNSDGDLEDIYFCDRMGQEYLFLEAIAPYVEPGSYVVWRGEDGTMWVYEFLEGKMTEKEVYLTW
jgi:hypothetical protein